MREFQTIQFELKDKLAIITLSRPDSAHALSIQMIDELFTVINQIDNDPSIICTIFTGQGDRVFCAGADLKERRNMSNKEVCQTVKLIGDLFTRIAAMKMPTIAAINGAAFGGGLELALSCDLRIGHENVRLGLTETSLAIIPGGGGTQRLARTIGLGQAKKMIFSSQPIDGKEAFSIGLLDEIVNNGNHPLDAALNLAQKICKNGPIALRLAKHAINQGFDEPLVKGLAIEYECYQQTIDTKDRKEGLKAFSEKRPPVYRGE